MKILVPIKSVADPDNANKVQIADGGASVDESHLEPKMNPFDEWSLEAAVRLTENAAAKKRIGEIVLVSIGDAKRAEGALRDALGKGAERGILVEADEASLDPQSVARIIAKLVERESPDLVLMGKQSADGDSNVAGTKLAEYLSWPLVNYATEIVTNDEGKTLTLKRELDVGVQSLKVSTPCVMTTSDRILQAQSVKNGVTPDDFAYADLGNLNSRLSNLKNIMAARKKPIDKVALADLEVDGNAATKYAAFALPPKRSGNVQFVETVEELVQKLHSEAKVV